MEYRVIICRSLTYAQRGERILASEGIRAAIVRISGKQSGRGCAFGLRVAAGKGGRALSILINRGLDVSFIPGEGQL